VSLQRSRIHLRRAIILLQVSLALSFLSSPSSASAAGSITNCTNDTQLAAALASGGLVTFNCGGTGASATIIFTATRTITTNTTVDGGGKITLSGGNARALFLVNAGSTLTLQNLTIRDGRSFGGGAITNNGSLVLTSATMSQNTAAGNFGGAIKNHGTTTISGSTFTNNTAPSGYGGAIDSAETSSQLIISSSTFSNNSAQLGGGAIASNGTIQLTNSTFSGNTTQSSGQVSGGGAIETTGPLIVSGSTFVSNTADCQHTGWKYSIRWGRRDAL
jgi:predicted outer membrane repeat protein